VTSKAGYRGYIGSRPVRGTSFPQRLQNLVVRDYAARRGFTYLLSATEHCMPGSYMMLEDVLAELPRLDGIIAFSLFQLPQRKERRLDVYRRVLGAGASFHAAFEDLALRGEDDIARLEAMLDVNATLPHTPFAGRDEKGMWLERDATFRAAILGAMAAERVPS
jgi:sporadic carbohydrate cluster protein (TIGR04323 family)